MMIKMIMMKIMEMVITVVDELRGKTLSLNSLNLF